MMEQEEIKSLEYVTCPRCGNVGSFTVATGFDYLYKIPGEYQAAECLKCHLWFQNPRPVAGQLTNLYPEDYLPHQKPTVEKVRLGTARILRKRFGYVSLTPDDEAGAQFDWRQLVVLDGMRKWKIGVSLIPNYVIDGKLLEIGCATGGRLLSLRRLGWKQLDGIELIPAAAEQARSEGFPVIVGEVEDAITQYPDREFDVIVSSMVLEHLYNPFQVVKLVARKLKPGGQFIFSTVIRDGLDAKIFGSYWSGFDFPRHMVYFKKSDLYSMLEEHFEKIRVFHQNAPIDFARPAVSRLENGRGTIFDRLVLVLAQSKLSVPIGLLLAWFGLTCRVSFSCFRKFE